ncbi:PRC-barrel domain-containing protein [Alkalicoccobacillus murimartini]|uniref:Uncharacterized protein YrrD n=1 Tax=Alkalicoccobacillus murimartini TaxID=171685 RepID=A0ABT9YC63_9BACI|nr:PRC-barrel domain-containing protein [Alkalicoccobacillus murimartini]MDQ0205433.1 uncharacterized protein YrrD [Alkalicoccobacillus murimartini]
MRTFAVIHGLPVIETKTGNECGRVIDLLLCNNQVTGLLVDMSGWLNRHRFVLFTNIVSVGEQAVMIRSKDVLEACHPQDAYEASTSLAVGRSRLKGMELLSDTGTLLGLVEDVYFHENLGTIEGYKVTDGLLADLTKGQKMLTGHQLVVGKERAILSN